MAGTCKVETEKCALGILLNFVSSDLVSRVSSRGCGKTYGGEVREARLGRDDAGRHGPQNKGWRKAEDEEISLTSLDHF